MPYYALNIQSATTNATPNTETDMLRLLTIANQRTCWVRELLGGALNFTTVGGMTLRLRAFGTASTVGTASTPSQRDIGSADAAQTTAFTLPTAGSTNIRNFMSIGLSQTGGTGGWQALEPDESIQLRPNGGANGNLDVFSIATTASVPFDYTLAFLEQ